MIERADSYDIISNEETKGKESDAIAKELDYDMLEVTSVDNEPPIVEESRYNEITSQNQELIDSNNELINEKKELQQKLTDFEGSCIMFDQFFRKIY